MVTKRKKVNRDPDVRYLECPTCGTRVTVKSWSSILYSKCLQCNVELKKLFTWSQTMGYGNQVFSADMVFKYNLSLIKNLEKSLRLARKNKQVQDVKTINEVLLSLKLTKPLVKGVLNKLTQLEIAGDHFSKPWGKGKPVKKASPPKRKKKKSKK